jgi:hypothetical protein
MFASIARKDYAFHPYVIEARSRALAGLGSVCVFALCLTAGFSALGRAAQVTIPTAGAHSIITPFAHTTHDFAVAFSHRDATSPIPLPDDSMAERACCEAVGAQSSRQY